MFFSLWEIFLFSVCSYQGLSRYTRSKMAEDDDLLPTAKFPPDERRKYDATALQARIIERLSARRMPRSITSIVRKSIRASSSTITAANSRLTFHGAWRGFVRDIRASSKKRSRRIRARATTPSQNEPSRPFGNTFTVSVTNSSANTKGTISRSGTTKTRYSCVNTRMRTTGSWTKTLS